MFLDPIKTGPVLCTTALSVFVLHNHALVRWFCCYTTLTIPLLGLHLLFLCFPQEVLAPATLCPIACLHCPFPGVGAGPSCSAGFSCKQPCLSVQQFTGELCIYFGTVTPMYGCVCAYDTTSVLQSIRFEVPNVEIETLCQRACSCPQLRGGPEQRDFTASCLHGAISPTCAFPPISHLQSRKWELGSIDENERNVFETPQKGPVFVPTIRHHQNEPTDPPIWCWHQHQTKMLVCHLCFREGGQFAWPKCDCARVVRASCDWACRLQSQTAMEQ